MLSRIILIFGLTLPLAACGGDDEQVQEPPAQEQVEPPPPFVAPVAPAPEPEPLSGPLYTIQMGAFLNADSAAVLRDRLADQGLPAWTVDEDVGGRPFHRVRIGATSTGSEARRLGEILTERYGWSVWIAPVTSFESVPVGAIEATQTVIGG
jgi:cell division septation protein DedD